MDIFALHATDYAAALRPSSVRSNYTTIMDGLAVVEIVGVLDRVGAFGTSTNFLRRDLRTLAGNPDVRQVLLYINSPGGRVAGTRDLADEVAALARVKPVTAHVEDIGASAAYWVASQAGAINVAADARVGSIGTYGVLVDSSGLHDAIGIKVHVVRAGKFKGAGVPGSEITGEHLAEAQRNIDAMNELFLASVTRGRRMDPSKVAALADGRVHVGREAVALGLADGVATFERTLGALMRKSTPPAKQSAFAADKALFSSYSERPYMSQQSTTTTTDPVAAFNEAIRQQMASGKTRQQAVLAVARLNPELHAAYVQATK